jgi:hypothetical protein
MSPVRERCCEARTENAQVTEGKEDMMHDREILDRVRRTETRVTKIGRALGIDVGGGKPVWDDALGRVVVPSPNCSVGDIVNAVPEDRRKLEIDVYVAEDYLLTLFVDP